MCFSDFAEANCGKIDYGTTMDSANALPGLALSAIGTNYQGNMSKSILLLFV